MPSTSPPPTEITPRQYFAFCTLGTGSDSHLQDYEDFVLENGEEITQKIRAFIRELTGLRFKKLLEIAPEQTFANTDKADSTRSQIRKQMIAQLAFLDKYRESEEAAGLQEVGRMANDYVKNLISSYFNDIQEVKMNNEIETCNDVATLTLMAFNDKLSPKVKFEAARKLFLMKFLGEIRNSDERKDHEQALAYMMRCLNERILQLPEGARLGEVFSKYLISEHDPEDFRTVHAKIMEEEPEANDTNKLIKVTHLPTRMTRVTDDNGEEREIYFSIEPREKTDESRLTKTLRYDSLIGEKDLDRNGLRLAFASLEDWKDFFKMLQTELRAEIEEDLRKRLENEMDEDRREVIEARLRAIHQSVALLKDPKNSLEGNEFNGSSQSSSKELKILKLKLLITRANGRQHTYEFQVFLPDGYADAMYRKGVSWEEYSIDRFFRNAVDELIFPKKIYPKTDRNRLQAKLIKQVHRGIWNGESLSTMSAPSNQ